jgi:hypothetical protein
VSGQSYILQHKRLSKTNSAAAEYRPLSTTLL